MGVNVKFDFFWMNQYKKVFLHPLYMVVVAQLVRALDCGSRGRRFEPGLPPMVSKRIPDQALVGFFVFLGNFSEYTSVVK